jgi:hypothetical protein
MKKIWILSAIVLISLISTQVLLADNNAATPSAPVKKMPDTNTGSPSSSQGQPSPDDSDKDDEDVIIMDEEDEDETTEVAPPSAPQKK